MDFKKIIKKYKEIENEILNNNMKIKQFKQYDKIAPKRQKDINDNIASSNYSGWLILKFVFIFELIKQLFSIFLPKHKDFIILFLTILIVIYCFGMIYGNKKTMEMVIQNE